MYRLGEPESIRYKQVVVFGVRRTRRDREQLKDWDVQRAKTKLLALTRNYDELPVLPDEADKEFALYKEASERARQLTHNVQAGVLGPQQVDPQPQ